MPKQTLDPRHQTNPLIWCAAIICAILAVIVIFTGIVVFISYLTIKPKAPKISVTRAQLNTIYFDQSNLLTVQVTIVISAGNDNSKARANFYDTRFYLSYRGLRIAHLRADTFGVTANSSVDLNYVTQATSIPLNPRVADEVSMSLRQGMVTFELQGSTRTRWRLGYIGSVKSWLHLQCLLHLPVDMSVVYPNCTPRSKY